MSDVITPPPAAKPQATGSYSSVVTRFLGIAAGTVVVAGVAAVAAPGLAVAAGVAGVGIVAGAAYQAVGQKGAVDLGKRRDELAARLQGAELADPPGASATQLAPVRDARALVQAKLDAPSLTEALLVDAEKGLTSVGTAIAAVQGELAATRARLAGEGKAILATLNQKAPPDGTTRPELAEFAAAAEEVRKALPDAPAQGDIDAAKAAIVRLDAKAAAIGDAIAARAVRREELGVRLAAPALADPADASADQAAPLAAARKKIRDLLDRTPLTDGMLTGAEQGLGELATAIADVTVKIAAEAKQVAEASAAIVASLAQKVAPAGAPEADRLAIEAARQAVRDALPPLPKQPDIAAARSAVDRLDKAIATVQAAVQAREARRVALAKTFGEAALADPADATAVQRLPLTQARAAIQAKLDARPLSDLALDEAATGIADLGKAVAAIVAEIKRLGDERKTILANLAKTADPPGATKAEAAAIEALRKAVRDALPEKSAQSDIDAAKLALTAVTDQIAETRKTTTARFATRAGLAAAQAGFKEALGVLPDGARAYLRGKLDTIQVAFDAASDAKAYGLVDADLATLQATLSDAAAFGARQAALLALVKSAPPVGPEAVTTQQLLDDADALAAMGDFTKAVAELAKVTAVPGVASAAAYQDAQKGFFASPGGSQSGEMKGAAANLHGADQFRLRQEAIVAAVDGGTKTFADGANELMVLTGEANAFLPVFIAHKTLSAAVKNAAGTAAALNALRTKLADGRQAMVDGDPAEALKQFNAGLASPAGKSGDAATQFEAAKKAVKPTYDQLTGVAAAAGTVYLRAQYAAAIGKAPANVAAATTAVTGLKPLMGQIGAYRGFKLQFARVASGLPPALVTKIGKPSLDDATANLWPNAVAKSEAELAVAAQAQAYMARRGEVAFARGQAPVPQQPAFDEVLARAGALADPGLKFAEAVAVLDELKLMADASAVEADATAYLAAKAAATKIVARASAALDESGAVAACKQALAAALAAVDTAFQADKTLADARSGYDAAAARAQGAIAAARERLGTVKVRTPLLAAVPPGWTAAEQAKLAAADVLLGNANFAGAAAAYKTLRADLAAAVTQLANALEGTDHGHSIAAHGPDSAVPLLPGMDDPQVIRVKTGVRADGAASASTTASSFESEADWLAARQMALEKVIGHFTTLGSAPQLGARITAIVEHGRPIDRCVVGLCKDLKMEKGVAKADRTCSTYEVWTGLTRTRSGFEWVSDGAGGGRWKLGQQFPHPDSWDDVNKVYTEDVPPVE